MTQDSQRTITLDRDSWQELLVLTHGEATPCFQCGVCTAVCPWGNFHPGGFNIRDILRAAQLGESEKLEQLWLCTACSQCAASCPRGVDISEVIRSLRYLLWKNREHLDLLPGVLWSCYWNNNPLGQPPSSRMDWAADLGLESFDPAVHSFLLYVGCTCSYDRRSQAVAKAFVEILRAASVSFGVLGLEEPCCGESVFRLGHTPYFKEMATKAIETFKDNKVQRIIALSPHCYDVFINEYPALGGEFQVSHASQVLADLLEQGKLKLLDSSCTKVTYHDPCLLGRANGEYEAPRSVLRAVPGLELTPIDPDASQGLCCGGGGGRMYLETPPAERFGDLRVDQARATGADILATACPLCISCLEDSMKVVPGRPMLVKDIIEIIAERLA
jgi:Fe-S oxidoreductase